MFHKQNKLQIVRRNSISFGKKTCIEIYIVQWIELHSFPTQYSTVNQTASQKKLPSTKFLLSIKSALLNIKYSCAVLFSRQMYSLSMYSSIYIFPQSTIVSPQSETCETNAKVTIVWCSCNYKTGVPWKPHTTQKGR